MGILTSLILKEWFKTLFAALTILFLLITVGDFINGFLQGKGFTRVFLEYSFKIPDLMSKVLPMITLLASLFSFNRLKSTSELTAILASGKSVRGIYLTILVASFSMILLQFLNLGYIKPYANKIKRQEIVKSQRSEGKYLTRGSIDGGMFWLKSENYFASFDFFDRTQNSLEGISLYFFDENHLAKKIIKAQRAIFSGNTWRLENGITFNNLLIRDFPEKDVFKTLTIQLNERPEDFKEFEADLTTLNFFKLRKFIAKISATGINTNEYQVLLWQQVSLSLICAIFSLIPLSALFKPNRRSDSFGKSVITSLLLTLIFWITFSLSINLGNSGKLPSVIAVFAIPAIFSLQVFWTLYQNRKLAI